jgi:hypothetical protein
LQEQTNTFRRSGINGLNAIKRKQTVPSRTLCPADQQRLFLKLLAHQINLTNILPATD